MASITITARCHPALEPILPKPVLAKTGLPDWLKAMPSEAKSETLGGAAVRTVKHCPPFLDAIGTGLLMPLACDLTMSDGDLSWDWSPPAMPDQLISRAPIGVHVPDQLAGSPLADGRFAVKFMNFWTLSVPKGWSILFTHPLNRDDLPFRTLSGLVDCDRFGDGLVHFPAQWTDPDFQGTLPAGTPVAQAIPFERNALTLDIGTMSEQEQAATRAVQEALQTEPGVYRKSHRAGR